MRSPSHFISTFSNAATDPQKRAVYDSSGGDPDSRFGGRSSSSDFATHSFANGGFDGEVSPEELFNMFFGGGGGGFGPGFSAGFGGGPSTWSAYLPYEPSNIDNIQQPYSLLRLVLAVSDRHERSPLVADKRGLGLHPNKTPGRCSSNSCPSSFFSPSRSFPLFRTYFQHRQYPNLDIRSLAQQSSTDTWKPVALESHIS